MAVANTTLIEDVVEVERVGAPECLPDGLARGRGDPGVGDVDLILANELLGVFGVERDVGLAIVLEQLHLAAKQAAGRVDLVNRHRIRHHDRLAVDVEHAGIVLDAAKFDRRILGKRARQRQPSRQRRRAGGIQ
jgi:hypothetical protein